MNVIKRSNLPSKLPFFNTLTIIMALSFFHVPGWLWGVVLTITALFWLVIIAKILKEKEVDLFDEVSNDTSTQTNAVPTPHHKSRFMRKLKEEL